MDTVIAAEKRGPSGLAAKGGEAETQATASKGFDAVAQVQPSELLQLAPRLAEHVMHKHPDWNDVARAASDGLRHDLGISQSLWGEACLAVGRITAVVALAVVSTKPREHFTRGAGGYYAAMIKRAKTGGLHLDRSLWKLRRDRLDRLNREAPFSPDRRNGARWH